jgi:hypothetical protein
MSKLVKLAEDFEQRLAVVLKVCSTSVELY